MWTAFSLFALLVWGAVLLLPSQPCRIRERLESSNDFAALDEVTVLIPARNEAAVIGRTLSALREQGSGLEIIVIDDGSDDETAEIAAGVFRDAEEAPIVGATAGLRTGEVVSAPAPASPAITIVTGEPLPRGWGGKLWALQQGLSRVRRPYTLLLDADIVLAPGMLASLLEKIHTSDARLVSIMARLRCENFWERLLVPPFIFFFKLIYPFAWVKDPGRRVAAAAGGCLFVETAVLREVDAFMSIRHSLIDDCALASRIKGAWLPHLAWFERLRSQHPGLHNPRRFLANGKSNGIHPTSIFRCAAACDDHLDVDDLCVAPDRLCRGLPVGDALRIRCSWSDGPGVLPHRTFL